MLHPKIESLLKDPFLSAKLNLLQVLNHEEAQNVFAKHSWISAVGARVCYSKKSLKDLFAEPKIQDPSLRAEYLLRLAGMGHFSVFAHQYMQVDFKDSQLATHLGASLFKSFYNPSNPTKLIISLRHYIEALSVAVEIAKVLVSGDLTAEVDYLAQQFPIIRDSQSLFSSLFEKISNAPAKDPIAGTTTSTGATVYLLYKDNISAVFAIEGISRVSTHQLVRHAALNFNQRSQRYTSEAENSLVIPPSMAENPEVSALVEEFDRGANTFYQDLIKEFRIPKQDARYILPHGRKSTIVVSGPRYWIEDFIGKRTDKSAQWEIREIAGKMQELLNR